MVLGWVAAAICTGATHGVAQANEQKKEASQLKERREDQRERQAARKRAENPPLKKDSGWNGRLEQIIMEGRVCGKEKSMRGFDF